MTVKRILCAQQLRRIPARFSWIDQRFVFDGHLERCDANAAALYLLLVTVADVHGLSYWGDERVARLLHMLPQRLARARADLIGAGLVAYERPLYQVLALAAPMASSSPAAVPSSSPAVPSSMSSPPPLLPASSTARCDAASPDRQELLQRLSQLGTWLKAPR